MTPSASAALCATTLGHREDIHAPTRINPADYHYERTIVTQMPQDLAVAMAVAGPGFAESFRAEMAENCAWIAREGWPGGNFAESKTCDHCGARFIYGAAYRHIPTNEVIVVGHTCADETMSVGNREELDRKRLVDRVHAMRQSVTRHASIEKRRAELREIYPDVAEALAAGGHRIIKDMASRFEQFGQLSEKQIALVRKITDDQKNTPPEPVWLPVEAGRRQVEGIILAAKLQESHYGSTYKMLLQIDREDGSEKVWATIPAAISDAIASTGNPISSLRTRKVELTITIKQSPNDPMFGLGSRPTGGRLL